MIKKIGALFLMLLQSCAFSPPFNGPQVDFWSQKVRLEPEQEVIVAVTNATLDRKKRKEFDQRSQQIYTNLKENAGYIGGTVHVQIFGDEVWTMSAWTDRESLARFVDGRRHLDAMYMTNAAMTKFRSMNFTIKARELPLSWAEIKKRINTVEYNPHQAF